MGLTGLRTALGAGAPGVGQGSPREPRPSRRSRDSVIPIASERLGIHRVWPSTIKAAKGIPRAPAVSKVLDQGQARWVLLARGVW